MTDPKETVPSDMPDASEAASLAKLIEDEINDAGGDDAITVAGGDAPGGAKAAQDAAEAGDNAGDQGSADLVDDGKGNMIPKARFDEVLARERETLANAEKIAQQNAELAERIRRMEAAQTVALAPIEAPAARDFNAEQAALQEKYDAGDLTTAEFMAESRKLTVAEAKHEALVAQAEQQRATATKVTQAATQADADQATAEWKAHLDVFLEDNPQFLNNPLLREDFQKAVHALDDGKIAPAELIASAQKSVLEARGLVTPAPKEPTEAEKALQQRRIRDALRAAGASAAPPVITDAQGTRGAGTDGAIDVGNLSRDEWARLTPAQRDRALGIDEGPRARN